MRPDLLSSPQDQCYEGGSILVSVWFLKSSGVGTMLSELRFGATCEQRWSCAHFLRAARIQLRPQTRLESPWHRLGGNRF